MDMVGVCILLALKAIWVQFMAICIIYRGNNITSWFCGVFNCIWHKPQRLWSTLIGYKMNDLGTSVTMSYASISCYILMAFSWWNLYRRMSCLGRENPVLRQCVLFFVAKYRICHDTCRKVTHPNC